MLRGRLPCTTGCRRTDDRRRLAPGLLGNIRWCYGDGQDLGHTCLMRRFDTTAARVDLLTYVTPPPLTSKCNLGLVRLDVTEHRWTGVVLVVALCLPLMACSVLRSGGAADAGSFTYEAEYGDISLKGEADVIYTAADGQTVSKHVALPWKSETIEVTEGRSYHLEVRAPQRTDAALSCGMHVDSGWNIGQSIVSDRCAYTFPDGAK